LLLVNKYNILEKTPANPVPVPHPPTKVLGKFYRNPIIVDSPIAQPIPIIALAVRAK